MVSSPLCRCRADWNRLTWVGELARIGVPGEPDCRFRAVSVSRAAAATGLPLCCYSQPWITPAECAMERRRMPHRTRNPLAAVCRFIQQFGKLHIFPPISAHRCLCACFADVSRHISRTWSGLLNSTLEFFPWRKIKYLIIQSSKHK